MLKKEITFTNFNDEEVTKTYWFNLNKLQAMKLVSANGGIDKYLSKVVEDKNTEKFIDFVENLVIDAYGRRDENDPEVFDTSDEAKAAFKKSPAFDEFVYFLLTSEDALIEFILMILPKDMREKLQEALAQQKALPNNA